MMLHDRGFHLVHERYIIRDLHRIKLWVMLPRYLRILVQHIFGACDILDGIYHSISSSNEGVDPTTINPPPYPPSTLTSGAISTSTTPPPKPPSPPPPPSTSHPPPPPPPSTSHPPPPPPSSSSSHIVQLDLPSSPTSL